MFGRVVVGFCDFRIGQDEDDREEKRDTKNAECEPVVVVGGEFHDGEKRTEISIDNPNLSWDDVKNFPYVCWYNK